MNPPRTLAIWRGRSRPEGGYLDIAMRDFDTDMDIWRFSSDIDRALHTVQISGSKENLNLNNLANSHSTLVDTVSMELGTQTVEQDEEWRTLKMNRTLNKNFTP